MAYPFAKWPSLSEFVKRVKEEFKAEEVGQGHRLLGPRGPTEILGLKIGDRVTVLPENDGKPMPPSTVRSLCDRLGIPPDAFGFTLADWSDDDDPPN